MIRFFINALSKGLSFSQSESKGVLILILVVILALTVPRFVISELKKSQEGTHFNPGELKAWVAAVKTSYTEKKATNATTSSKPYQAYGKRGNFKSPTTTETVTVSPTIHDLNTASLRQLQEVRGIGPAYSKRINKYRELLGGFSSMDQLEEVYGLDSVVLHEISKKVCNQV